MVRGTHGFTLHAYTQKFDTMVGEGGTQLSGKKTPITNSSNNFTLCSWGANMSKKLPELLVWNFILS